jgi:hypothetical protein
VRDQLREDFVAQLLLEPGLYDRSRHVASSEPRDDNLFGEVGSDLVGLGAYKLAGDFKPQLFLALRLVGYRYVQ